MREIFQIGRIERFPLRTPYTAIVERVSELVRRCPAGTELVIDGTGVGVAVVDLFHACGVVPIPVTITAGTVEGQAGSSRTVPKILLISKLDALVATGCLKIQADLAEADTLIGELQDYRVQYTAAGHLTTNARQGAHDDIILASALAIWRLAGGGMSNWGLFETYRQQGAPPGAEAQKLVIGLDLGQKGDFSALVVARRLVLFPDEFAALDGGPLQPMGGGIVDLPVPVSQPESTVVPPDHASPEWQDEVNEGIKRELRGRGITSGGPLRAAATLGIKPWGSF
jgi:hypothetical protein